MSTVAGPRALTFGEARARVMAAVRALPPETVPLAEARGRALRRADPAGHDLPPFRNASMDGYAVVTQDLAGATTAAPVTLPVSEVLPAGRVASRPVRRGEAMRIMTGAQVPDGANAVVAFEDCTRLDDAAPERVRFTRPARHDENIRPAGRDLREGEMPLTEGRELSAYDLGLLAALGEARLRVGPRARVGILSTGDELLDVDQALKPGAIRDSNRPMLALLAEECGAVVTLSERVRDEPRLVVERVRAALPRCDVLFTIGGVSAGDFDPVKQGLADLGAIELWRVAMKPGRPQAFGAPDGKLFFGLPGNPASVACVFEMLARPALRALMGHADVERPRLIVHSTQAVPSREGRTDFVRVTLERRDEAWWATAAGDQVSGHLTPQSRAHALLVVDDARAALAPGDRAEAVVLRWPAFASA